MSGFVSIAAQLRASCTAGKLHGSASLTGSRLLVACTPGAIARLPAPCSLQPGVFGLHGSLHDGGLHVSVSQLSS